MQRLLTLSILTAALALPAAAGAATITVATTADSSGSQCTLHAAIEAADSDSAKGLCPAGSPAPAIDTINFNLPAASTVTLLSAPTVTGPTAIVGPGASQLTVTNGDTNRLIETSGSPMTISGLTLAHGKCGFGCGLRNVGTLTLENVVVAHNTAASSGGTNGFPEGAGIENTGTLTLIESTVTENITSAVNATNQNAPAGGGIRNGGSGTLTLERSTVSANTVSGSAGGVGNSTNASGAGISNTGVLNVIRSTISGNTTMASGGTASNNAQGGGIFNANAGSVKVKIDRSTISGNTATATGASATAQVGAFNVFGTSFSVTSSTIAGNSAVLSANVAASPLAIFKNTIVANPLGGGPNCSGVATSAGYNLTDTAGCGFILPSDKPSTNPMLSPAGLADNGGPTRTIALLAGSPAIDQGLSSAGEIVDQRGLTRPVEIPGVANAVGGDGTDIGAFEEQLPTPPGEQGNPGSGGAPPGTTTRDVTPPKATIKGLKAKTHMRKLKIRFTSSEAGSTFKCKLDGKPFKPCSSPFKTKKLSIGSHKFVVIATDAAGNASKAAKRTFKVLAAARKPA